MSFASLSSILEPYNFRRRIIGFDTFRGFPAPSEEDLRGPAVGSTGAARDPLSTFRKSSAPTWIRTRDLLLRRESLYPAELSGLVALHQAFWASRLTGSSLDGTSMAQRPRETVAEPHREAYRRH